MYNKGVREGYKYQPRIIEQLWKLDLHCINTSHVRYYVSLRSLYSYLAYTSGFVCIQPGLLQYNSIHLHKPCSQIQSRNSSYIIFQSRTVIYSSKYIIQNGIWSINIFANVAENSYHTNNTTGSLRATITVRYIFKQLTHSSPGDETEMWNLEFSNFYHRLCIFLCFPLVTATTQWFQYCLWRYEICQNM